MTDLKKLRELAEMRSRDGYVNMVAECEAIIELLDRLERYEKALIEFADYDNQYEPNMVCWPASDYMRKAREALEGGK